MFDTLSSPTDTVLYTWSGCGGPEILCNDDFDDPVGNTGSYVGLEMTAGQQIFIVVDSYSTSGNFTLDITGPVAAGNCCAERSTPGCEVPGTQTCVCQDDAPCCSAAWDRACVEEAIAICEIQCH